MTLQREIDNIFSYLDLQIIKTPNVDLLTNWYRKPSWFRKCPNQNSHNLFCHKVCSIKGLVDRCVRLSDIQFEKGNLNKFKKTSVHNNNPLHLFNDIITKRIHEIYNSTSKKNKWINTLNFI